MNKSKHFACKNSLFSEKLDVRNELVSPLHDIIDNFYSDFVLGFDLNALKCKATYPKWDVYENDQEFLIEMAVPGCTQETINVEVVPCEDNQGYKRYLKISGKCSEEHVSEKSANFKMKELKKSSFVRSIYLPNDLKEVDPEATLKNGILKLKWEKHCNQKEQVKKIKITNLD
jgi:HSP20 family molecular chaperone IbpA